MKNADEELTRVHKLIVNLECSVEDLEGNLLEAKDLLKSTKEKYNGMVEMYDIFTGGK